METTPAATVRSSVPKGIISLWSGSIATIPPGWALCDGNNGTPDLRDKFIVGAKQDDAGVAKTNITGALTVSGGSISHTHSDTFSIEGKGIDIFVDEGSESGVVQGHTHNLPGSVSSTATVQPYYALAYVMKL